MITRTGREGQAWAEATRARNGAASVAAEAVRTSRRVSSGCRKGLSCFPIQPNDNGNRAGKATGLPGEGVKEADPKTGLRPPADNSWDRREDFSAAHRARKSTRDGAPTSTPLPNPPPQGGREHTEHAASAAPTGFSESPQAQYTS